MMRLLPLVLIALPLTPRALPVQSGDPALSPSDLAYGIELVTEGPAALQTLLLPEEVYRGLQFADLRDLRVFNAAGEPLPHAVRRLTEGTTRAPAAIRLPLFAIRAEGSEGQLGADLALRVRRSPDGRVLEIKASESARPEDAQRPAPVLAYIMDTSQVARPAVGLQLEIPEGHESFLASYTLETSSDLSRWSPLVQRATLARLEHDGAQLQQSRIRFPPTRSAYLRLRWLDAPPALELAHAELELAAERGALQRRSVRLEGQLRPSEAGVYDFPSAGPLPVQRLQVHLPAGNTLIEATLQSAQAPAGPWTDVLSTRFYRVTQQTEVINEPRDIAPRQDRHWRLRVAPSGGGLGEGLPQLELFYYPEQLAFVARGEGPFTLAFGAREAPASNLDWASVTQMLSAQELASLPRQSVQSGELHDLGGAQVLLAAPESEWQAYALWAVLIAGVALLSFFSLRLARQLK